MKMRDQAARKWRRFVACSNRFHQLKCTEFLIFDTAARSRPHHRIQTCREAVAAKLAKLSEALFVDTLRRYLASLPEQQVGWLAAARDPIIGKSLMLMHSRSPHPWTIAELAKEVGVSRSSLVERFTRYLSEPPMAYLIHLGRDKPRMNAGKRGLR